MLSLTDKHPLRRHHDDDYWDRVTIQAATGAHFTAFIRPRYKTSGLSGDEWRVSAAFEVREHPMWSPIVDREFHRMNDVFRYAPIFVYQRAPGLLSSPDAKITVERKGRVLMVEDRPTFGDAVIGLGWHVLTANEGKRGVEWHHLTDAAERQHCQQVGCARPPINAYQLQRLQIDRSGETRGPKYDWEGQYVWYCGRHTTRGDCGLEDADKNMVLVAGTGQSTPDDGDESPSGFAGAIGLGDDS